jgi:neurexin
MSLFLLFFFSGHGTDYLNLALRDGGVSLTMGLSNGKQEMHIKPSRVRFDDHQWHKVTVHRRIQEVSDIIKSCWKKIKFLIASFVRRSHAVKMIP